MEKMEQECAARGNLGPARAGTTVPAPGSSGCVQAGYFSTLRHRLLFTPHLRSFMSLKNFLRPLAVACALTATFSACSSGTKEGDTNVERGYTKKGPAAGTDGTANGDSATAGLTRDTTHRVTGKELYKAAGDAKDRNHDGIAD
jgi:hypothetical protein